MSRKRNVETKPESVPKARKSPEESISNLRGIREIVESLVVALVLALIFRAFAAEAFVIPTGSMASTLMGRHKDIYCEQCHFPFQISASEEANDGSDFQQDYKTQSQVLGGTCPQCRWANYVGSDNFRRKTFLSFNGDRIFVNKSQFDFRDPARWHVTVFRYPGKPQMNYIKRLVGLENETIRIRHGDIFVKKQGEDRFEIQRKPLRALQAMLRPVDDNDYVQPKLHEIGWPVRWSNKPSNTTRWERSNDYKSFRMDAQVKADLPITLESKDPFHWLCFHNVIPSSDDWFYLSQGRMPGQFENNPQLITDFLAYNTGVLRSTDPQTNSSRLVSVREVGATPPVVDKSGDQVKQSRPESTRKEHFIYTNPNGLGRNWVGDLALSCQLTTEKAQGVFCMELVKGGETFRCLIDLATGEATLSIPGLDEIGESFFPDVKAPTPIRAGKSFDVMFCNIDEELRLIVENREIDFGSQGRYDALCEPGGPLPRDRSPTQLDLTPASFGVYDAIVKLDKLKLQRDMYYIACNEKTGPLTCDLRSSPFGYHETENTIARVLSTPDLWGSFGKTNMVEIKLGSGEYMMLGDNSAKSQDSRLWTTYNIQPGVDRRLLIGEAVFVYWPHGHRIPGTRLALIPNFSKVRFID